MNSKPELEYRRSAAATGWIIIVWVVVSFPVVALLGRFLLPIIWQDAPDFAVVLVAFAVLMVPLVIVAAVMHIVRGGEFICRITEGRFEWILPPGLGGKFSIRIDAIVKIERRSLDGEVDWYLWDNTGQRHPVENCYGNPVEKFMEAIQRLNSKVIEVDT